MEGLKIKCTTCGGVLHETTDKYDPNKTLNGSMVRLIYPWKSWGWSAFDDETANISTTPAVLMCCPNCSAPLVKNGRLTIVKDIKSRMAMNQEAMKEFEKDRWAEPVETVEEAPLIEKPKKFLCPVEGCGKSFDIKIALVGHMRSHKDKTK